MPPVRSSGSHDSWHWSHETYSPGDGVSRMRSRRRWFRCSLPRRPARRCRSSEPRSTEGIVFILQQHGQHLIRPIAFQILPPLREVGTRPQVQGMLRWSSSGGERTCSGTHRRILERISTHGYGGTAGLEFGSPEHTRYSLSPAKRTPLDRSRPLASLIFSQRRQCYFELRGSETHRRQRL
jgi:hypothetical protein